MTDNNWELNDMEIELANDGELADVVLEVVEGSLELPPDLADEAVDGDMVDQLEDTATAQAATDMAVEVGDYESAHQLRELAEDELAESGSEAVLEGPTSVELEQAAEHQERAAELQSEQAELAEAGDYESAGETSREAAIEMREADGLAGGSDHSGQAQLDADNMEWADFHQDISNESVASAADYFEAGNLDAADNALGVAGHEQDMADNYGDLGEHGNSIADFDPASYVESNPVDTYSPADVDVADTSSTIDTTTDTSTTDFSTDTTSTDDFSS